MSVTETEVTEDFIESMRLHAQPKEGKGLLESCSNSVILFAEKMLGFKLYAWQIDFLTRLNSSVDGNYHTREFLAVTSRQIGKSTLVAIFALWSTVFNKLPSTLNNNTSVLVVSASDVQAKKLLYEIKKMIRIGDSHMKEAYKYEIDFFTALLDETQPNNTTTISFKPHKHQHGEYLLIGSKNGSVIKSYPPTAVVLGETASVVIIDEAGKTDRISDTFFYDYAYPTGNSTDAIRIYTSTPWVLSGFFYRMVDPADDFSDTNIDKVLYTIDAIKIENPKYFKTVKKIIDQMNEDGKTDEVQRAYYCRFIKGEQSYFDPDKVMNIFDREAVALPEFKGECDMGIDFGGQKTSKTVITISYLDKKEHIQRIYDKVYEVQKDLSLLDDVEQLLKEFNVQRIIPDDCPEGDFLIRRMIEEKGWNVTPMNFRTDKVKKYGAFRSMLNKGKVHSYEDTELKTEMMALENSQGSRQSVIMAPPGYNDDRIDSFVLSSYHFLQDDTGFKVYDWDDYEN